MRYNRRALSSRMSGGLLGVAARVMTLGVVVSLLLLFAGMGALVVIHVCVVGRVFRRGLVAIAREQACAGLPPEDLEVLPCYEHSKLSADNTDGTGGSICAVCQEGFLAGDRCRLLPLCGHSFHAQCVDSWLLRSSVCPICRTTADVRKGQAAPAGGRETSEAQ